MPHNENEMMAHPPKACSGRVWAGLISSMDYLPGLLTLEYSLRQTGTKYPFIALYPDTLPVEVQLALDKRGIARQEVPYLTPASRWDCGEETRWNDVWTKLNIFSLVEYERVALLDLDMLVVNNMDELMDLELNDKKRVFAATPLCTCNPAKRPTHLGSWPKSDVAAFAGGFWPWEPSKCPFSLQHHKRGTAHLEGPPIIGGKRGPMPNAGLLVVSPSLPVYTRILAGLATPSLIAKCTFPEQDLLKYLFPNRWVSLPYIYNAIKSMRWDGVHSELWDDKCVKNIHYNGRMKPWGESKKDFQDPTRDPTHQRWWDEDEKRIQEEAALGI